MSYDPEACGAKCSQCILQKMREGSPVPPQMNGSAISLVTGAPDLQDVMLGQPLSGSAGIELNQHLKAIGVTRADVNVHLAVACQPPAGKMERVKVALTKENKRRKLNAEPALPSPVECCRPRLLNELAGVHNVVLMGKDAFQSVTMPPHRSVIEVQGNMYAGPSQDGIERRVVPVVHPGQVVHEPKWRIPFRTGLDRAFRWFSGRLEEVKPTLVMNPGAAWFREHALPWLMQQPRLIYDTETNDLEPLRVKVYTVQVGTPDYVIILAFRSKVTGDRLHSWDDCVMMAEDIEKVLTQGPPLFGHNAGSYDRQVMWAGGYEYLNRPVHVKLTGDTLIIHRHVAPDLPHRLGFVGAMYSDIHDWKGDGKDPDDDPTFWRYGGLDVSVSGRIIPPLLKEVEQCAEKIKNVSAEMKPIGATIEMVPGAADPRSFTSDLSLIHDHQMQGVCVEMHGMGIRVDQRRRAWAEAMYRGEEAKWLNNLQQAMIDAGYGHLAGFDDVEEVEEFQWRTERQHEDDGSIWLTPWTDAEARKYRKAVLAHEKRQAQKKPLSVSYNGKGSPRFNPRSGDAMRRLLFDEWDLPFPTGLVDENGKARKNLMWTKNEDRSVDDTILRAYLADKTLSEEQHRIIHAARRAKKMGSMHRRFLKQLRPFEDYQEELELWMSKQRKSGRRSQNGAPALVVWEDGRARFNWNAIGTGVGRLSAGGRPSRMNPQTFPDILRWVFVPEEGHCFVGADLDSIHVKLIANLWRIPSLLNGFLEDPKFDPHAAMADIIYGDTFKNHPGHKRNRPDGEWAGIAKKMRGTAKSLRFAGAYGATVPTIYTTMTRQEDEYGNLADRELTMEQVRLFYKKWMGAEPEWRRSWENEAKLFRAHSYMLSPILGRRADFTDGEDQNKLNNYRILSGEGDIMGPATVRVRNKIPPGSWSRTTGLLGQFHDAMLLEVPVSRAKEAADVLTAEMNVRVPGWPIPITATAKIGYDWKAV